MTDRELLELAAKAAGLDYIKDCVWIENGFYSPLNRHERIAWNPLKDDGDAFRLAARLGIDVTWNRTNRSTGDEELRVARRAIVKAAAKIGSRMP